MVLVPLTIVAALALVALVLTLIWAAIHRIGAEVAAVLVLIALALLIPAVVKG